MDLAYIFSHDGDEHGVKFGIELCSEGTLAETVRKHLYPAGDDNEEFDLVFAHLTATGAYDFEDGWIVLKRGAVEIAEFLMYQLREAKAEERYADQQRYKELQAKQAAEARFARLRDALADALGPNAPVVAKAAA